MSINKKHNTPLLTHFNLWLDQYIQHVTDKDLMLYLNLEEKYDFYT